MKFVTLPIITLTLALGPSAQTAGQISRCKNYAARSYTLEVMNYMPERHNGGGGGQDTEFFGVKPVIKNRL
ncbi:hypothetical protein V2G26_002064 [Clonostachys chloroleuca]